MVEINIVTYNVIYLKTLKNKKSKIYFLKISSDQ
jgi:hypothetical protein